MSFVQSLLSCGCHNHNTYKMLQAHGWVGIKSFDTLRTGILINLEYNYRCTNRIKGRRQYLVVVFYGAQRALMSHRKKRSSNKTFDLISSKIKARMEDAQ